LLPLAEGRKLYEQHVARPRVTGGVRMSTQKKYRSVLDKFLPFAVGRGVTTWNGVTPELLCDYVAGLEAKGYAHKTQSNELITLKQAIKWLIKQGHLHGMKPIDLSIRKAEGDRAYCYRAEEVRAMIEHCHTTDALRWLANVIIALACTGLRIAELVSLRWTDLNLEHERLTLTDETGRSVAEGRKRRELKSGRSRSFPIHPDLFSVLKQMPRIDGYVFHGPRGGRLKPDTVRRILVREVIEPLTDRFSSPNDEKCFRDGRLHSFRHYFCSTCANNRVPERMVMEWLGHADSEMVRNYYHLHDEEARRRMAALDFLGGAGGCSAGEVCQSATTNEEVVEPDLADVTDA
jgi:integrase